MISGAGSGWQTVTADLALILFLITAQAVREHPEKPAANVPTRDGRLADAGGLAVYRPGTDLPLSDWLRANYTDQRQAATITVRYGPGQRGPAMRQGAEMLETVTDAGVAARLVVEQGNRPETLVTLDFEGKSPT